MNKQLLTEQEVRTQFITPAIKSAGWAVQQIREEYAITKGRIIARGGTYKRDKAKYADYILFYKPHIPLAVVEAKDNNHTIGDGMQQAMDYAQRMMIPFVFTSNGDGFTFHNRMDSSECVISLDSFPSPEALWKPTNKKKALMRSKSRLSCSPTIWSAKIRRRVIISLTRSIGPWKRSYAAKIAFCSSWRRVQERPIPLFKSYGGCGKQASKNAYYFLPTEMP